MNRNLDSRFALAPEASIKRSKMKRPSELKTSFDIGQVIPIYSDEVLPGDTHSIKLSKVVRLQTPITPFMGNIYLDTYWYFVPLRLVWEHTKEFYGENTQSAWVPQVSYTIPQISAPSGGWNVGTLADYFGWPTGVSNYTGSALYFRAYALVMNEFFRSTAVTDPLYIPMGDATQTGSNGSSYIYDVANGGAPFVAAKGFDYFTACLPSPQFGSDVAIGLTGLSADAPVVPGADNPSSSFSNVSMHFLNPAGQSTSVTNNQALYVSNISNNKVLQRSGVDATGLSGATAIVPGNLHAIIDQSVFNNFTVSINAFRTAFQLQKFYEKTARTGQRFREIILAHFGCSNGDARMQVPEYLGGSRCPIAVNQVVQTSQTATTPQGTTAAYSVTSDVNFEFVKSFTEPGILLGLACARYDHVYQQGLERRFSRLTREDFYWPEFQNLGEMAVLNKEIYLQGNSVVDGDGNIIDDQVFGYQEYAADYRYKVSLCTGEMRSAAAISLDVWHLGDDYSQLPSLSDGWIREDKSNVDRVLQVQSSVANQLFGDFWFETTSVRPMPMYSIPGLVDHH